MTWRETIQKTAAFLESKNVPEARTAGELLAARLLKTGRGFLSSKLECEVAENYLEAMRRAMQRLIKGEPLQYVLGEWGFRTLVLSCDKRALIPRPETEGLVSLALKFLSNRPSCPFVVDVGTGTGAIILSIAAEFKGEAVFLGTDISADAIKLAKENAKRCGLSDKVKFAISDGLDEFDEPQSVDAIISNPPYVTTAEWRGLDARVRDFEPRLALDGGADGLAFYERYLADALNILKPSGAVFFEIGEEQGSALDQLMRAYGFIDVTIEKDYAGHDRYASGRLP
jgi:release factor glutamine methyltransferase